MSESHRNIYEQHSDEISRDELQILKQHEPFVNFHILGQEEAGLSLGRQSRVSVMEYELAGEMYRVLWKRMGAGKHLDTSEATGFDDRLEPYRQSLLQAGWRVPSLYFHKPVEIAGEAQIFSYEQHIPGGDGEKMLQDRSQPNFRKWFLIENTIQTLSRYPKETTWRGELAGKVVTRLPHGLDLKLANLVLEKGTNHMYFVDLFGPKELDATRSHWITYSTKLDSLDEEALMAVCASREGAILRCWRLAEEHWNNGYADAGSLRSDFIGHLKRMELPDEEVNFITNEVQHGYPWLNSIYDEQKI